MTDQPTPARRRRKPRETASTPAVPYYVAARRMQRNGEVIKPGDVIPDAGTWPRLESWLRAGYLKEVS